MHPNIEKLVALVQTGALAILATRGGENALLSAQVAMGVVRVAMDQDPLNISTTGQLLLKANEILMPMINLPLNNGG